MDVKLVMFKENGERKDLPVQGDVTVIGRRDDCDLRIPLPEVSRRHAQLMVEGQLVTLRDLGSANGTYVNNERVTELQLKPGDHLVVGPVVFTVQIGGEPAAVRPVRTKLERRVPAGAEAASAAEEGPAQPRPDDLFSEGGAETDPISALEALAAGGDQETRLEPFDMGEEEDKPQKS